MTPVRVGAVGYLNARPHVFGLERSARFALRFDLPSRCATLLHEGAIDIGLIPSVEYLFGDYRIVSDVAIASRGPVASVKLYTTRPFQDVRSIALDTSSRSSVAMTRVLCARHFWIQPRLEPHSPNLETMLAACDAALLIGDQALFLDPAEVRLKPDAIYEQYEQPVRLKPETPYEVRLKTNTTYDEYEQEWQVPFESDTTFGDAKHVEAIDLGEVWTKWTGLPFVYAFWAGRAGALTPADVLALQQARDTGITKIDEIVRQYFPESRKQQEVGAGYLRDNIKYDLGPDERAGLERFYRYAVEAGVAPSARELRFY